MRWLFWAAVVSGPLALVLWWLAALSPGMVENLYSRGLYPVLMAPWSRITGGSGAVLAPLLLVAALIAAVLPFFFLPPLRALASMGAGLSVLLAWFVLGWGLNYQRLSWAESHGSTAAGGTLAELEALAGRLLMQTNVLRSEVLNKTSPNWTDPDLPRLVTQAYERKGALDPLLAGRWGSPKAFPVADILSWAGIAGIFIPFTGEPLVNTGPADWQQPFTQAHEAAHLRGWAREDEANFLAFFVLQDDQDPRLAYSAWGSALLYVASALEGTGAEGAAVWAKIAGDLDEGVREDWRDTFAYWDRFKGPVRQAAQAVNDVYLKSQGQSDGIKSYGRMVDLLLVFLRDGETDA